MQPEPAFFPRLFEPAQIGKLLIRNRIIMPSMGTGLASVDGEVTDVMLDYYEARAMGGTGLVIAGNVCVDSVLGKSSLRQPHADDDRFLPGLSRMAAVVKKHGAGAAVQLHHAGGSAHVLKGQAVGPSAVGKPGARLPRELRTDDILAIVELYASAGERMRLAGFDGVEVMAARGYLLSAFLSAAFNKRHDEYGGTVANRARFLSQVIRAIKARAGNDYPVWCRIDGREYRMENGITIEEGKEIARLAQEAGADAIHVVSGDFRPAHVMFWERGDELLPPSAHPEGFLLPLAAGVKTAVGVPVIGVGRITPQVAEDSIKAGMVDFVAMGRALIADPDLPNKAREGRARDIIPCILCLVCRDQPLVDAPVRCSVNPASGKERQFVSKPATVRKKVAVIGSGPAGVQSALVAARRGHDVTIYEGEEEIGGQLRLACLPPYKSIVNGFTSYLDRQLEQAGVKRVMGTGGSIEQVLADGPEVIVVATGSNPIVPRIPGIDDGRVVLAAEALTNPGVVGQRVVVIGGGLVGCETAEFLAEQGREVTIVELRPDIAIGVGPSTRPLLLERLLAKKVASYCCVSCEKVVAEGIVICNGQGEASVLNADSIVLAAGAVANRSLLKELEGKSHSVYTVGDCAEPRCIADAVEEGARIGLAI